MIGLVVMTLAMTLAGALGWTTPFGAVDGWGAPLLLDFAADGGRRPGLHAGVDLAAPCGTPVHAIGDGEIVALTRDSVTIAHTGSGLFSRVDHLARVDVGRGPIARGAPLGLVGRADGEACHLHLSVRVGAPPDRGYTFEHPAAWGYLSPARLLLRSAPPAPSMPGGLIRAP